MLTLANLGLHINAPLLMRLNPAGVFPGLNQPPEVPSRSIISCAAEPLRRIKGESAAVDTEGEKSDGESALRECSDLSGRLICSHQSQSGSRL